MNPMTGLRTGLMNTLAKRLGAKPVYTCRFYAESNIKQSPGRRVWETHDAGEAFVKWKQTGESHEAGQFQLGATFTLGGKVAQVVKRKDNQLPLDLAQGAVDSGEDATGSGGAAGAEGAVPAGPAGAPDHGAEAAGDRAGPQPAG